MTARRTAVAVALAALGLAGLPPAGAQTAAPTPQLRWEQRIGEVVESSPLAVDLDGDGTRDVVVGAWDGQVWALDGRAGGRLPGWPVPTGNPINSSPAVADVDADGRAEVFIGSGTAGGNRGGLLSFEHDGIQRFRVVARDEAHAAPAVHSTPAVGDVRPDGVPDATFGTAGVRAIWSVTHTGAVQPGFPLQIFDSVFSSPALTDVDRDGAVDFVIGGDSSAGQGRHQGGQVRAVRGDGRLIWEHRTNDIVRSSPSVGDIDGDGIAEIVVGGGDFFGGSDGSRVWALGLDGRVKPGWPQAADGLTIGSPALADVNGDGRLDVAIGTDRRSIDQGSVYVWDGGGRPLPGFPRRAGGQRVIGSVVTGDLDGDGAEDLLVPGRGIFAYSGRTGGELFSLAAGRAAFQGSPVVTDVDGNGLVDIVATGSDARGGGLAFRWELGAPACLGPLGWHQFRRDDRRTGSWTAAGPPAIRDPRDACPPDRTPPAGYDDVPPGSTHAAAVDCATVWEVTRGSGGGFRPDAPVTREQMAGFLARLVEVSGGALPENARDAFSDDATSTFHDAINALAAAGVVTGFGDGTFKPGEPVSRAQMATFLVRAFELRAGSALPGGPDWFIDDTTSAHHDNINRAALAGFAGGSPYASFRPLHSVSRGQMASFLVRVLDRLVEEGRATVPF